MANNTPSIIKPNLPNQYTSSFVGIKPIARDSVIVTAIAKIDEAIVYPLAMINPCFQRYPQIKGRKKNENELICTSFSATIRKFVIANAKATIFIIIIIVIKESMRFNLLRVSKKALVNSRNERCTTTNENIGIKSTRKIEFPQI